MNKLTNIKNYQTFLKEIKEQIQTSQARAIGAVKSEMIVLYFNVGKAITQKQKEEGWGAMVIKKLSLDLQNELPKVKDFSERNIKFMHQFYNEYAHEVKGKLPVSLLQVSWSHNIVLMQKLKDRELREWYRQKTIQEGWGRDTLIQKIKQEGWGRDTLIQKIKQGE